MVSNLAFHIGSLIAFFALLYWVVTLKESLAFSRFISRSYMGEKNRVMVDWPLRFLKRLAVELGIAAQIDVKPSSGEPLKIQTAFWIAAMRDLSVQSIQASYADRGQENIIVLTLNTAKEIQPTLLADMQKQLGQNIKLETRHIRE